MRRPGVLLTYEPDNLFERQVRMWGENRGACDTGTFLKEIFSFTLLNFPRVVRELMLTK